MTDYPPRIFTVTYRSAFGKRRRYTAWVKVPYSGLFNMNEVLARALSKRLISYYRVEVPRTIPPERRSELARWQEALAQSSTITGVDWNA